MANAVGYVTSLGENYGTDDRLSADSTVCGMVLSDRSMNSVGYTDA